MNALLFTRNPSLYRIIQACMVIFFFVCGGIASGQFKHAVIEGETKDELCGQAVATIDDIDDDGYKDLLVGAPRWSGTGPADAGRVYAISGRTGEVIWTFEGAVYHQLLGWSVAGLGDADLDGIPDAGVGGPHEGAKPGKAWILSGVDGSVLQVVKGEYETDFFGDEVGSAGDFDNDNHADLAVGAKWFGGGLQGEGKAYVYSGKTGQLIACWPGENDFDNFGCSLAAVGDWDQDGRDELAIGSHGSDKDFFQQAVGKVVIMSSSTHQPMLTLWGDAPSDRFGFSVACAGDVNHDGAPDLLAGSFADYARVHLGPNGTKWHLLEPESPSSSFHEEHFAIAVDGAGDVDRDGHDDLAVGACGWSPIEYEENYGRLYVFSGATGEILYWINGTQSDEFLGRRLSGKLDGQMDGLGDVAVGGWGFDGAAGEDTGHVVLVAGSTGKFIPYGAGNLIHGGFGLPTSRGFPVEIRVLGGPVSASGCLFAGMTSTQIPLSGKGTLYVWPLITILPITTDTGGIARLIVEMPDITPHSMVTVHTQAWFLNGGVYYYSNGLTWEIVSAW